MEIQIKLFVAFVLFSILGFLMKDNLDVRNFSLKLPVIEKHISAHGGDNDGNPKPILSAREYIVQAHAAYDNEEYEKARDLWFKALEAKPVKPELVYHDIALTYLKYDNYIEANKYLEKSIEIKPTAAAYLLNARSYRRYLKSGQPKDFEVTNLRKKCIENYKKAIELYTNNGQIVPQNREDREEVYNAYKGIGYQYKKMGQEQQSQKYYTEADKWKKLLNQM